MFLIYATNITGFGALTLCKYLFNAFLKVDKGNTFFYLPANNIFTEVESFLGNNSKIFYRHRILPNSISRLMECILPNKKLLNFKSILVMGDLPLRINIPQVVYVHQPHLINPSVDNFSSKSLKYILMRFIFKINLKYATRIIVQTNCMRDKLVQSYPQIKNISIIGVPPPSIYINSGTRVRNLYINEGIRLFYPAANYQHKNHSLLHSVDLEKLRAANVEKIILTIDQPENTIFSSILFDCIGKISPEECLKVYKRVDALLFLSKSESYGIPLVEAMYTGIFIVCPNLSYARDLCGDGAIYFEPDSPSSLCEALIELNIRRLQGEKPNWEEQINKIPKSWNEVAERIIQNLKLVSNDESSLA